jgi:uncharacterized protein YacL
MLHAIRAVFAVTAGLLGYWIGDSYGDPWRGFTIALGLAIILIVVEFAFARRFIGIISVLMFGLFVGFVAAHLLLSVLYLFPVIVESVDDKSNPYLRLHLEFSVIFICSFVAVIAILHTKDDLKFVVPFVELKREGRAGRPLILDTSVIIDGRIADVIETRIVDVLVVIPRFVLLELQQVADSGDKIKRNRGRRGLDILNRLRRSRNVEVQIHEGQLEGVDGVDAKLVRLAKIMDARIVTNDFNLNKVAEVQGVEVVNVNDLSNALRPVVLQGERLAIKILRAGDSPGQGVGYLEDGTMVVAEECSGRIGQQVDLVVTNVIQTAAGRLIFARPLDISSPNGSNRK